MRFAEPMWLWIGAAATVLVAVALARGEVLKHRAVALLAGAARGRLVAATPSLARRSAIVIAGSLAVAAAFVALARPQVGLRWEAVQRKGTDLMLVVDTSRSMDADDVKPTRLERTKLAIHDLVEKFPQDRIGLVAFAGNAFVESPMTLDHVALLENVDALDTRIVARGGTNLGRAIDVATDALATEPDHSKAVVVLSDGEQVEGDAVAEAKKAEAAGIVIDTVGVGGAAGEIVPERDERGRTVGVVHDASGAAVRSKLDEQTLRAVADATHGSYLPLGDDGRGLERLYAEALAPRAQLDTSAQGRRVYAERYEWPLAAALVAMLAYALLGVPRRRSRVPLSGARGAATAAMLVAMALPGIAHASVGDAQRAFAAGKYEAAHDLYEAESKKHPDDAALSYDAGDAAYRAGRYDAAKGAFERALRSASPKLQKDILYNDGNALFRLGESHLQGDRARTKEEWKQALSAYDGALALDGADADARYNRDLVARRLAELEKKDEPKKDPQQKDQSSPSRADQPKSANQQGANPQNGANSQQANPSNGGNSQRANAGNGGDRRQQANPPNGGRPQGVSPANAGDGQDGQPPNGTESRPGEGDARLSRDEARALLQALSGEERRGRAYGARDEAAQEDPPKEDW